jgi:hypothetical protein
MLRTAGPSTKTVALIVGRSPSNVQIRYKRNMSLNIVNPRGWIRTLVETRTSAYVI